MKFLVDNMPKSFDECPFFRLPYKHVLGREIAQTCGLDGRKCDLHGDNKRACRWLKGS